MRDHCHSLQELDIYCTSSLSLIARIKVVANPIHVFSNLTQLSILLEIQLSEEEILWVSSLLVDILVNGMPALRDLHLEWPGMPLSELLERAHWPSLQRFTLEFMLGEVDTIQTAAVLAGFLDRHPKIKCFSSSDLHPSSIPVTSTFRSFTFSTSDSVKTIVPLQALRHIHSLKLSVAWTRNRSAWSAICPAFDISHLLTRAICLEFVQLAPELERLGVTKVYSRQAWNLLIEDLLTFKHLTHLILSCNDPNPMESALKATARLASIRSLQYIKLNGKLWRLERNKDGGYLGCIELWNLATWDRPDNNWGGHYFDIPECVQYTSTWTHHDTQ